MTDRFVTVPDSLELPEDVKVPSARLSDSTAAGRALLDADDAAAQRTALGLGTAATTPATDYATAAQGAKADASDVTQITLTGNLALTIPEGHPAGQVYRCAITQTTGGHAVTYDGNAVAVDLAAGAVTTVELHPVGTGYVVRYPSVADLASLSSTIEAMAADLSRRVVTLPLSDYLADGQVMPSDGATDASALINLALADADAKAQADTDGGIYIVGIPAGRFRLDSALVRNLASQHSRGIERIGARGAGMHETVLVTNGDTSCWAPFSTGGNGPCAANCHWSDFTIDMTGGPHPDPTGGSYKGFTGGPWEDCTFRNIVVIASPATAIGTDQPRRVTFINVHVVGTGLGADGESTAAGGGPYLTAVGPKSAAMSVSGFGIGFGTGDDQSVLFIGCSATDCYRGGFFFEQQTQYGATAADRDADIRMVGCRSYGNRIGLISTGVGAVTAINCDFVDNSLAGVYSGVSYLATQFSSIDDTLIGCRISRNGIGVYSTGDSSTTNNPMALHDVLGGFRMSDCHIEDNATEGIFVERFKGFETGGVHIRNNTIRRNGGVGVRIIQGAGPCRDLALLDNYIAGNGDAGAEIMVPLNAPRISGNYFADTGDGVQTVGLALHPAEPVTEPIITHNTFTGLVTPMRAVSRLDQDYIADNRILDATSDPEVAAWLHRQTWYGSTGSTFPVDGDGWAKQSGMSAVSWYDNNAGIAMGAAGSTGCAYRDLGTGVYCEVTISRTASDTAVTQLIGVCHSLHSGSGNPYAIVAGVNGTDATWGISDYYAVWKVSASVPTLLWQSTVPRDETHRIGVAREGTLTHIYIDGALVHSLDIPSISASATLHGILSKSISRQGRYISEFRAMAFTPEP